LVTERDQRNVQQFDIHLNERNIEPIHQNQEETNSEDYMPEEENTSNQLWDIDSYEQQVGSDHQRDNYSPEYDISCSSIAPNDMPLIQLKSKNRISRT
jgi:hypothetical protein